eukprot:9466229-Pyramimonas_sp.AAC.1
MHKLIGCTVWSDIAPLGETACVRWYCVLGHHSASRQRIGTQSCLAECVTSSEKNALRMSLATCR